MIVPSNDRLEGDRDQIDPPERPKRTFGDWFAEHQGAVMVIGVMVAMMTFAVPLITSSINSVSNSVANVQTDVRELRKDINEVKSEVGGLESDLSYIRGKLDNTISTKPDEGMGEGVEVAVAD